MHDLLHLADSSDFSQHCSLWKTNKKSQKCRSNRCDACAETKSSIEPSADVTIHGRCLRDCYASATSQSSRTATHQPNDTENTYQTYRRPALRIVGVWMCNTPTEGARPCEVHSFRGYCAQFSGVCGGSRTVVECSRSQLRIGMPNNIVRCRTAGRILMMHSHAYSLYTQSYSWEMQG